MNRLAGPVLILLILGMMILRLPPLALDLLFSFNIALSIIVLLVALYTTEPLQFSAFPTVLLITTLMRLSLNVASTRQVLLEGHTGPDAAGKVIEAFGHFLVGGNYTVGIIVFIILIVINFVVITKGAGRIAEVSARFTLDAMPGKQMAIDADLNSGMIQEEEARRRRRVISQEADFFGSMDGASKFVRGDAIAGIFIMFLNIVGGLLIGIFQHDLSLATATTNYTLLTIGDGLVAQIPALIISTAAGIVVSRVATDQDLSEQLVSQLFKRVQILYTTASLLALMGLIPKMPHVAFLLMAAALSGIAYSLQQTEKREIAEAIKPAAAPSPTSELQEVGWNDVSPVDLVGLEVGYRLIPLVDRNQDGELLRRIRGIRKKIAQELGFLVPAVHIRDNLELKPNAYCITLKGVNIGNGEAFTGMFLAINPGQVLGDIPGAPTKDPAFGLPAVWIDASNRDNAQSLGYTVVDASTVVATHLSNILNHNAAELLGREEVQALVDHVAKDVPKLVEELVPKVIQPGVLQRVLQNLLEDGVHIRDMRTIIETMGEHTPRTQDPEELTTLVRTSLGRAIIHQLFGDATELDVIALDPQLEHVLLQAVQAKGAAGGGIEPGLADTMLRQAAQVVAQRDHQGLQSVLMVPPPLRPLLARFLRRGVPQIKVVSHGEIPDTKSIKVVAVIGRKDE